MEEHKQLELRLKQQQEFYFNYHLPYKYYKLKYNPLHHRNLNKALSLLFTWNVTTCLLWTEGVSWIMHGMLFSRL